MMQFMQYHTVPEWILLQTEPMKLNVQGRKFEWLFVIIYKHQTESSQLISQQSINEKVPDTPSWNTKNKNTLAEEENDLFSNELEVKNMHLSMSGLFTADSSISLN